MMSTISIPLKNSDHVCTELTPAEPSDGLEAAITPSVTTGAIVASLRLLPGLAVAPKGRRLFEIEGTSVMSSCLSLLKTSDFESSFRSRCGAMLL